MVVEAPRRKDGANGRGDRGTTARGASEELDERKGAILNAVVREYIQTAQPVGSAHVMGAPGVGVSSATVRNEMAALEREGYLSQPHTSSGRIPTDKGYRYFVDHLRPRLSQAERAEVRRFFARVHGEVEELLRRATDALSSLTSCAAVVAGPIHDSTLVRSAQLVALGPRVALLVLVLADGTVEKRTVELPDDTSDAELAAVNARLEFELCNRPVGELGELGATGDPRLDRLVRLVSDALATLVHRGEPEHVYVGGSAQLSAAFDAVETVRTVLGILEQQLVVVQLIEDILDQGLSVAIGTEHGFEPLAACALVVAPVSIDGETAGTIGVLGPTRMNYPKALSAVHLVGEELSERLGRAG
jgi:heat-inducible transcriptional repressor